MSLSRCDSTTCAFWYTAPEATYLAVYVEDLDVFLAEDVRDVVDRQWGVDFPAPGRFGAQECR